MKNPILRAAILMAGLLPAASTAFAQNQTSVTYYGGVNSSQDYLFSASIGSINYSPGATHSFVGLNVRPGSTSNSWKIGTDGSNNGGAMLLGGLNGSLTFLTIPAFAPQASGNGAQSFTDAQILAYQKMQISPSGQVMIGKTQPTTQTDYKLAVEGKLVAQSMYVTNPSTWADYVFAPTYKVMPLPELEAYLRTNKHLPYIPAAEEVQTKGYNVAEMDANLLRTVEELTLQLIELRKQVEQLKAAKASN
jgi:hypothetical protein